ncbi:MAG TPA: hypothetical protein VFQ55_01580 [Casimicrobiaceae bacterium]|nr:hypothetical protein [Casimicrobiaceae bacterium]
MARGFLHVLATLVVAPYAAIAAMLLVVGHSIAQGELWSVVDTLLMHALWILWGGAIAFVLAIVAIAVLGALPRTRALGATILAALAALSLGVLVALTSSPLSPGDIPFLLPPVAALAYATWLALAERRASGAAVASA